MLQPLKLVWKNNPIDPLVYKYFVSNAAPLMSYAPMNKTRQDNIAQAVAIANKEGASRNAGKLTKEQGASIIAALITTKIVKNWPRMNAKVTTLARKYVAGECILVLARKHDFPPLNLLRSILLHQGMRPDILYSVFARKQDPVKFLNEHDLRQFNLAESADATRVKSQREVSVAAQIMEDRFVDYIRKICPRIKTQNDLVKIQVAEFGRALSTPDVLFDDDVLINGKKVKWIDFKSYTLVPSGPIWKSTQKQAGRYIEEWGPGALCYRGGFPAVDEANIEGVSLLDCSEFAKKIFV